MAFKISSQLATNKNNRKQMLYDMPSFPEHLTDEQRREALVLHKKYLDSELLKLPRGSLERKMLGGQIMAVNSQISSIRKKFIGNSKIASFFISEARKIMIKRDFDLCMKEAIRLAGLIPVDDQVKK